MTTPNPFQIAIRSGVDAIHAVAGTVAVYTRKSDSKICHVSATTSNFEVETLDENGMLIRLRRTAFAIRRSELDFGDGWPNNPARGDTLTITGGDSKTRTYEVVSDGDDPPWENIDGEGYQIRVVTVETGVA